MIGSNIQSVLPIKVSADKRDLNPYGWVQSPYTLAWYRPTAELSTRDEAQAFATTFGANLASVHDAVENDWLRQHAKYGDWIQSTFDKNLFIGLDWGGSDWVWLDGTPYDFENWTTGSPNTPEASNPVVVLYSEDASGRLAGEWNNGSLPLLRYSIMMIADADELTDEQFAAIRLDYWGWKPSPNTGYWYKLDSTVGTWNGANNTATAVGGSLASIPDTTENSWLVDTLSAPTLDSAWIGLVRDGSWEWSNGDTSTFTNWDTANGSPKSLTLQDVAVLFWATGGAGDYQYNKYKWQDRGRALVDDWVNIANADSGSLLSQGWYVYGGTGSWIVRDGEAIAGSAYARENVGSAPDWRYDLTQYDNHNEFLFKLRHTMEAQNYYADAPPPSDDSNLAVDKYEFRLGGALTDIDADVLITYSSEVAGGSPPSGYGAGSNTSDWISITQSDRYSTTLRLSGDWPAYSGSPTLDLKMGFDDLEIQTQVGRSRQGLMQIQDPGALTESNFRSLKIEAGN